MNGMDIRLGYMNLQGILGGKRTIRYESISDIMISMFSGIINVCRVVLYSLLISVRLDIQYS